MKKIKGISLILFASISFGFIPLFTKIAFANNFNPITFILIRTSFALPPIYMYIKISDINIKIKRSQFLNLLKISFFGEILMMITLTFSFMYIDTGLAMTLHYLYPVIVMILSFLFYNEKINFKKILAFFISIIGIYLLIGDTDFGKMKFIGFFLAIISGFFYAYFILQVSYSNINKLNAFVINFYLGLFNMMVLSLVLLFTKLEISFSIKGLPYIFMASIVINVLGASFFQLGVKYISASAVAILSTFEPMTSLLVGVFFLNESFKLLQLLGGLLIIISSVIILLSEKETKVIVEKNI